MVTTGEADSCHVTEATITYQYHGPHAHRLRRHLGVRRQNIHKEHYVNKSLNLKQVCSLVCFGEFYVLATSDVISG